MARWLVLASVAWASWLVSVADAADACGSRACRARVAVRQFRAGGGSLTTASWYDGSAPACGGAIMAGSRGHGLANKVLPCGSWVLVCRVGGRGRCVGPVVRGRVVDRGPFVAGRDLDLTPGLRAAVGCGDLCSVRYAPAR